MSNYRITISGGNQTLDTRYEKTPAVPAQDAKPASGNPFDPDYIPAKPAVEYKPAEYGYRPFQVEFDFENDEGYESGSSLFEHWLSQEEGLTQLADILNIAVEKQVKSYDVTFSVRMEARISAETVAAEELESDYAVERWVEDQSTYELDAEESGDGLTEIEVSEVETDWTEVDW